MTSLPEWALALKAAQCLSHKMSPIAGFPSTVSKLLFCTEAISLEGEKQQQLQPRDCLNLKGCNSGLSHISDYTVQFSLQKDVDYCCIGWNNLIPVILALAKLLKEHLGYDNNRRQKSKWIVELADEAHEISPCGMEIKCKLSEFGNIKDELICFRVPYNSKDLMLFTIWILGDSKCGL
eukprot:Em0010g21a